MLTSKQIEKKLAFIEFNQGCEGFQLTEKDRDSVRAILDGQVTGDDLIKQMIRDQGLTHHD